MRAPSLYKAVCPDAAWTVRLAQSSDLETLSALPLDFHWDAMFEKVVRFKKKYGHCSVRTSYTAAGRLYRWVQEPHSEWKKGLLRTDRRHRLKPLGCDASQL